jgi:hypothetical protein
VRSASLDSSQGTVANRLRCLHPNVVADTTHQLSAMTVSSETTEARAAAWMYVLTKGWLTQRQIDQATGFGKAAAERKAQKK